jgi:dTDP-4-dehydrorhamnose 3,5-epimerase-like enzyme
MKTSTIKDCSVIQLPRIYNRAGNITAINGMTEVPFEIKRVYYLYDVPGGETRGGHAHKNLHQLIVAAGGSFTVLLDDGKNRTEINLNRPYQGLLVVPGIWRELLNFSSGSICLVLASALYDESDYIRSYEELKILKDQQ